MQPLAPSNLRNIGLRQGSQPRRYALGGFVSALERANFQELAEIYGCI
jgi:hypothetical protein